MKYQVRISVLEYGCYEVEAISQKEAEEQAEEMIASGNVIWGDMEITDAQAEVMQQKQGKERCDE